MKKLPVYFAVLAMVLSGLAIYFSQSKAEIVYIDINKLVSGYKKTKIENNKLEKKSTELKSKIDTLLNGWQKELQAYEKERTSMTQKELNLKRQLLLNKQQQIDNYQENLKTQLQKEQQIISQTVLNEIDDYVKEYGKKKGYKFIFGATGTGNIMYADESTDITKAMLDGLNKAYDKK